MNPQITQSFVQYIKQSTSSLSTSLQRVIDQESLQYDVVYEKFLNIIETFKINMMKQMKQRLFQLNTNNNSQQDYILLHQMKNLINTKIRTTIEKINQETDVENKQKLIDYIGILNDSLQKIEINIQSHEHEYTHKGSPVRSELSLFHGAPHHDERPDIAEVSQTSVITPLPYKLSHYKSDDSAFSKMTPLLSESMDNRNSFKTPTPLSSGLMPRNQFTITIGQRTSESRAETHNLPTHTFNSFHRIDEQSETDTQIFPNINENNGMSLSEMFDACLNSIRQNSNAGEKVNKTSLSEKNQKIDENSKENFENIKPSQPYPMELGQKCFDRKNETLCGSDKKWETIENRIEFGFNDFSSFIVKKEEQKATTLLEKMKRIVLKIYLKKWKRSILYFENSRLDNNFKIGIKEEESKTNNYPFDIDDDINEEFKLKTRPFFSPEKSDRKIFDQENLLSDCMSFCDIEEQINECLIQATQKSPVKDHFDRIVLLDKENQDIVNKVMNEGEKEALHVSSLKAFENKKPQVNELKNQLNTSQRKEKNKEKTKLIERTNEIKKSPKREYQKKDVEKPKIPLGTSSIKKITKAGPSSVKKSTSLKVAKDSLTKENSLAYRASPVKLKKSSVGIGK